MRFVAQVFFAYGVVLVLGALWRFTPFERSMPDVVALSAVYLGLRARTQVAPAMTAAVVIGYLADLLMGAPRGMLATIAGILCLTGHFVQGRIIVRGRVVAGVFSFVVTLISGLLALGLRSAFGLSSGPVGSALWTLFLSAILTGVMGPWYFRLCRLIDARFARTQRERDEALEGHP